MKTTDNIKQKGAGQASMSSYGDRNTGAHRVLLGDPKVPHRQRAKTKKQFSFGCYGKGTVIRLLLHELEWLSNQFLNS